MSLAFITIIVILEVNLLIFINLNRVLSQWWHSLTRNYSRYLGLSLFIFLFIYVFIYFLYLCIYLY